MGFVSTLIWGAGAIGGTIGAFLQRSGHDVTLVDVDGAHVKAMNDSGLRIEGPLETFTTPVTAFEPHQVSGTFDVVLLCTKAHHTGDAMPSIANVLGSNGVVVSLQNGLNEWLIAEHVRAERTMGAFVNFGADYHEPGLIHFGGRGAFVIGELDGRTSEQLKSLHATFTAFDPDVRISDNIWGYLWGKMGYGAMLFASALTNESIADVLGEASVRPILDELASEVLAIARMEGVVPLGFNGFDPIAFGPGGSVTMRQVSYDAMVRHNRQSAKTHSGVWRDLAVRKRKTEIDAQFGAIVERARRHAIPTPTLTRMISLIHDVENGNRAQSWETLAAIGEGGFGA